MKTAAIILIFSACYLSTLAALPKLRPTTGLVREKTDLLKGSLTEGQLKKLVQHHSAHLKPTLRHDDPVVNMLQNLLSSFFVKFKPTNLIAIFHAHDTANQNCPINSCLIVLTNFPIESFYCSAPCWKNTKQVNLLGQELSVTP